MKIFLLSLFFINSAFLLAETDYKQTDYYKAYSPTGVTDSPVTNISPAECEFQWWKGTRNYETRTSTGTTAPSTQPEK